MANVLSPFIPTLFQAADVVSRELVGFIPSVARNSSAERAALNQEIIVPVSTQGEVKDVVPGMTVPEPDDSKLDNVAIKITKSKNISFGLTGEEYKGLENGVGVNTFLQGNFEQSIRELCNMIEADLAEEAAKSISYAYGTAGTTPFASSLGDAAQIRKILDDNGTPRSDRSLVIDTAAGANLRTLEHLTKVNEAGTEMTLRQGELLNIFGLSVKESAGIVESEKGTAVGLTLVAALKDAKEVEVKAVTSGGLKAGDIITIAGDNTKYVVAEAIETLAAGNKIKLNGKLKKAVADGAAVTLGNSSVHNTAFSRNAIQLVTRAPALPGGRDAAIDSYMLTDPRSGLSFEVRVYQGYRKMRVEVACAWGVKCIKPEHIAGLLG